VAQIKKRKERKTHPPYTMRPGTSETGAVSRPVRRHSPRGQLPSQRSVEPGAKDPLSTPCTIPQEIRLSTSGPVRRRGPSSASSAGGERQFGKSSSEVGRDLEAYEVRGAAGGWTPSRRETWCGETGVGRSGRERFERMRKF
jgi:hypothetical protein